MSSPVESASPSQTVSLLPCIVEAIEAAARNLREVVERLLSSGLPSTPGELLDFERTLHQEVARASLDAVTASVIQAAQDTAEVVDRAATLVGSYPDLRLQKSSQPVLVTLLGGSSLWIETPYFLQRVRRRPGRKRKPGRRGPQGNGIYPRLAALGIHYRVSPALGAEVARQVATGTVEQSLEVLAERGIKLDRKTVSRLAQRFAERALGYRDWLEEQAQPHPNGWARGRRIVIGVDGGRIRTRVPKQGKPRANGRRGFDAFWREPKVFVIYAIDENGRKIKGGCLHYDATLGDADRLFRILAAVLIAINAREATEWVMVGDGAEWIWDRVAALVDQVGFDASKVVEVLDFYHACEYLHEIASSVRNWDEATRKAWYHRMRHELRHGSVHNVLRQARKLCVGRRASKVRGQIRYFEARRHRMCYASWSERGIPLGSGAVESAVRRVVNLRLKGNGIFWRPANAEGILHLRAQVLGGHWHEFVRTVLDPEIFWPAAAGITSGLEGGKKAA